MTEKTVDELIYEYRSAVWDCARQLHNGYNTEHADRLEDEVRVQLSYRLSKAETRVGELEKENSALRTRLNKQADRDWYEGYQKGLQEARQ